MRIIQLLFLLSTFLSFQGFSQVRAYPFSTAENYDNTYEMPYHYLLGDSVIVRECPASNCGLVNVMRIGDKIKLLEISENTDIIGKLSSPWYRIEEGWIWGGLIAQNAFRSESEPRVVFLFGRTINAEKDYQIRVLKDNEIIARTQLNSFAHSIAWAKTIGKKGLKNLSDIIVLEVPCTGGCGCTTGEIIYFWNGIAFSKAEELIGVADAWASEGVGFIYPTDMEGIPGKLVKVSSLYIDSDEDANVERSLVKEYFIWNGEELVPDPSLPKSVENFFSSAGR